MVGGGGHRHDNLIYPSPPPSSPLHLLEITILSAQDLHLHSSDMSTFASAWVNPEHKLKTHVDALNGKNPSWNDKFIFRVDESVLRSDTTSVTIDIFASSRFRKNPILGTSRVVLSTVNPSSSTRFLALQVRRPNSLRPQGIINVGVSLLDAYIDNMPVEPAFGLKDFAKFYGGNVKDRSKEWTLERSSSTDAGHPTGEKEAKELESKLEKWRIELSPIRATSRTQQRRRSSMLSCFCCSNSHD